MVQTFHKLPTDSFFEDMDPLLKLYLYESWIADLEEKHKFTKDYTILAGSFHNPEAAKKMIQSERPDLSLTEQEVKQSMDRVLAERELDKATKSTHRRRRRKAIRVINLAKEKSKNKE